METSSHPDAPPDLARWGLHAFALGARSTPHRVVAMDDNGALLFHARHGTTFERLAELGIRPSASQIALLRAYHLLSVEGDRIATSFPVVGPVLLADLRPRIRELAIVLAQQIDEDIAVIASTLRERGWPEHGYAVVFGHVVDGLLWDQLKASGLAPSTTLSVERPFWNGVFWAIHPARHGAAGVNELPGDDATLVMVWTDATREALAELAGADTVRAGLADPSEPTSAPVVTTRDDDPIHRSGLRVAATVADAFGPGGAAEDLLVAIPDADRQQSVVIVAHELIWDLMEALTSAGRVTLPPAMRGDPATPENAAVQVFVRRDGA